MSSYNTAIKVWKYHPEQCDHCGGDSEIFTFEDAFEGFGYDGDPMRCTECKCPGQWNVYDEDSAYASWHDEIDCECTWCVSNLNGEWNNGNNRTDISGRGRRTE